MFLQLNLKNSSLIFFNQFLYNTMERTQNRLWKMEILFFEIEIWCVDQDCTK